MVASSRSIWLISLVLVSVVVAFHHLHVAQASGPSMAVYAMAVGQGDGNIILCPNGKDVLIVDMGGKPPVFNTRDYGSYLLKEKFGVVSEKKSIHIVVSHPHNDHYNQLTTAIDSELIPRVSEIVLSGYIKDYSKYFVKWLNESGLPVYTINSGAKCFGNDQCTWTKVEFPGTRSTSSSEQNLKRAVSIASSGGDPWQFCGSDVSITAMGANIAITANLNMKSVILKLVYNQWSLLMSGDFEGKAQQLELVNRWQDKLQSTYYKLAHHGAWTDEYKANLPELLARIRPKRVYVSHGYPSLSMYHHPNCQTIQHLLALGTIDTVKGGLSTPPPEYVCWNDTRGSVVMSSTEGDGHAIYETCHEEKGGKQVCRDIMIETDGVGDKTKFVDVPSKYIRPLTALEDTDASHRVRWENFMARHGGGRELTRSTEMKQLIRSGVPRNYRTQIWKWLTKYIVGKKFIEGQYEAILQQYAGQASIAVNQIELDLLRTLPTNKYYDKPDAQGIDKLRRVLVAFSWYDQNVGYCQGLNRLAAIALLFLEEADAFWCMVAIVHHILPGDYYSRTLLGSQTDQRVLKDLLRDKAPKLSDHLGICDIDFSLITFNWFHTVFVDNLPVDTMLRIWDTFLYEGSKVLFRFAIAIFKYNEEAILATENSIGIFNKLRTMCQDATDVNRLVQIGFHEINPFPKRKIEHMRGQYRLQIKAELEALDNLRSQGPPGPVAITTPISTPQDPPTADLLGVGAKDVGSEPSYKELLAEEDSDNDEETIFRS